METKCVSFHLEYDMMLKNALVVTGGPQKILKNDKTVVLDLVTTAGPAGILLLLDPVYVQWSFAKHIKLDICSSDIVLYG